jgi:hypothetical protein
MLLLDQSGNHNPLDVLREMQEESASNTNAKPSIIPMMNKSLFLYTYKEMIYLCCMRVVFTYGFTVVKLKTIYADNTLLPEVN